MYQNYQKKSVTYAYYAIVTQAVLFPTGTYNAAYITAR